MLLMNAIEEHLDAPGERGMLEDQSGQLDGEARSDVCVSRHDT
jgi:hypothetical protein